MRKLMPEYEDIDDVDFFATYLSPVVKLILQQSHYEVTLITDEEYDLISEGNELIEEVFPEDEADEYNLLSLLTATSQPIALALMSGGVIYGLATLNITDDYVCLNCLAIDQSKRDQKLGSILMLVIQDVMLALELTTLSLISSPQGVAFYTSFGGEAMASNGFEIELPFARHIMQKKITDIFRKYPVSTSMSRLPTFFLESPKSAKSDGIASAAESDVESDDEERHDRKRIRIAKKR
jgi:hypothetical protein